MGEKKTSILYRVIKWAVKTCYPQMEVVGQEHLPGEPVIFVGNHAQMNGPIACELYAPGSHYIWCAGEMMHLKEVSAYAYRDFWSGKSRYIQRGIERAYVGQGGIAHHLVTRSRAGGENYRLAVCFLPFADKLESNEHLAHADGMHIKPALRFVFFLAFVNAESLGKTGAETATLFHLNQIARNGHQQEDGEQQVVYKEKEKAFHDCFR